MKIIATDNYASELVSDELVCTDVDEYYGKLIVDLLNKRNGERGPRFFMLKPDNHDLYRAPKLGDDE